MSLKSDFDEVKKLWTEASWPMRILISISFILATSSITSLADVVFKWKGFILEAIEFYHAFIREPLVHAFYWLNIPADWVDALIVMLMLFGVLYKADKSPFTSGRPMLSIRYALELAGIAIFVFATKTILSIWAPSSYSFLFLTVMLIAFGLFFELTRPERIAYFLYVGMLYFGLLILAAINNGLTRAS